MNDDKVIVVKPGSDFEDFEDSLNLESDTKNPKIIKSKPVVVGGRFDSRVDIVIPFHGQYEKVSKLIESIFRFTRSNYYRITVIDDASPNDSFVKLMINNSTKHAERLKRSNNFRALRLTEQRGFAGAMKVGWENSTFPYVCFVNSDCVVKDINWLQALGESLLSLKKENVRMVSSKTNNPVNGSSHQKGHREESVEDVILENDHLSMYCFMCHRDLFSHCGGFIKEYPYGWYEDEEFAHRLRKYGFKQAVSGKSYIYHEGESTVRSIQRNNPKIQSIMENNNRRQCISDIKNLN